MADASAQLSIVLKLVDEATGALQGVSDKTRKALEDVQSQADQVRNTFGLLGGAIIGGLGVLAKTAADADTAQSMLTTAVKAGVAAADGDAASTGVLTKQKEMLAEQLTGVNAKLVEYEQKANSAKGATGQYDASIATLQTKQAALREQLDQVNNQLSLHGANVGEIAEQFQKAAEANTALGFTVTESEQAFTQLFRATGSVTESLKANQVAMDLARATGMDLTSAAKQVELAMEGNGRALKQFGINLKDGLSPGEALAELQLKLANTAKDYVNTPWGQLDVAKAKNEELAATLGNALIPVLTQFLQTITPLIQKLADWAQAHPRLTSFIILTVGAVGLLALGIAAVAGAISAAISVFLALSTVIGVVGVVIGGLSLPIVALIAAVGFLTYYLITHWNQIKDGASIAWDGIKTVFKEGVNFLIGLAEGWANSWVAAANLVIKALDSIHISIPDWIPGIGGKSFGISIPLVPNISLPRLASGGIVTGPTIALIGEAGPEAVVPLSGSSGAGLGGITININGGYYLDQQASRTFADMIAKTVNQQLRLRSI